MTTRRPFDLWEGKADAESSDARLTQAWRDQLAKDINLAKAHIVVELVFGSGDRYRAATGLLESIDPAGDQRFVRPVLLEEPEVSNDYDVGSSGSSRSIGVSVPGWAIDPDRLLKLGLPLSGFGEVSLLVDGMPWDKRRLILRGDMSGGISFGGTRAGGSLRWAPDVRAGCDTEPVELELQDPRESGDAAFPAFIADEDAWANIHDSAVGRVYPVVWGRFVTEGVRIDASTTSPEFVVAYGHGWSVNELRQNDALISPGDATVSEVKDANGVPVTTVKISPVAAPPVTIPWEDGDKLYADIEPNSGEGNVSITDVIRDAITLYTVGGASMVNEQLLADAEVKLNALKVSVAADEQVTAISWIEDGLLDELPMVSMIWDAGRYGPVVTDWRTEPRASLEVGTQLLRFRTSSVTESPKGDVFNSFTIRYGYNTRLDEFTKVVEATPDTDGVLAVSRDACGLRPHPVIESVTIRQDLVAGYLLDWMVSHLSLPTYFVEYVGAAALFLTLRRGDTVLLTDEDLRWREARATVETISYRRGMTTLGLRVWQSRYRTGPFLEP